MADHEVDPTKNVLDLVGAQAKYRDELRAGDLRFARVTRAADVRYHEAMLAAAVKRTDDLWKQKTEFDNKQSDILRLQIIELTTSLSTRVSEVEQFRYEMSGKGSGASAVIGYVIAVVSAGVALAIAVFKH